MKLVRYVLAVVGFVMSGGVFAYDLPAVNLGGTSFLDAVPGPSGLYWIQYVQQYHADKLKDDKGKNMPFPDTDIDVTVSITQLLYASDYELLGGKLGFQAFLPVVSPHASYDVNNPAFPQAGDSGAGDLVTGPFITFNPIMGENGIKYSQRVELTFFVPTGEYSSQREINPGSNFWSFDPFYSGTYFFTPDLTASIRAHYLWNGKNDNPNRNYKALGAHDTRAGQAFHMNFATEYAFTQQLRLGLNGYWLKQTTDTEMDGDDVEGCREQVLGLGVGGAYSFTPETHLFFNYYNESHVENRAEGQRYNFRFVHHF